jgi:hypothetical protein
LQVDGESETMSELSMISIRTQLEAGVGVNRHVSRTLHHIWSIQTCLSLQLNSYVEPSLYRNPEQRHDVMEVPFSNLFALFCDNISTGAVSICLSIGICDDNYFCTLVSNTKKNAVFWDVTPSGSCKNRPFGGTYRPHH